VSAPCPVTVDELAALEARVQHALATDDTSALTVLGYGEISSVLLLRAAAGSFAAKRLPRFDDATRVARFGAMLDEYLAALRTHGVNPVESWLVDLPQGDGSRIVYIVQPLLDPAGLGPERLRALADRPAADAEVAGCIDAIVTATAGCVSRSLGLDAQLSNWVFVGEELRYLDVTTPLLNDERGQTRLDTDLYLASLPALLRWPVKRFVLPGILGRYHDRRAALRDLVANLHMERLAARVPDFLARINRDLEGTPLTAEECLKDYQSDASTWALLQTLRRWDRTWQRKLRRRTYPFLLPGPIER
jgi:hypothetical protein